MNEKVEKYPEGHFVGIWMCIGIVIISGIGIPLGLIMHNYVFVYIGPAIGVALGMVIGQSIENKYKNKGRIRPLTEKEQKKKNNAVIAGAFLLILGVFVCLLFSFP
jgi:hypothetical protein